ncbi:TetR/AcrR family transcriptional regulator [Bradyrhizobium lablabi]|uniref:TetR/AcrR family transcriptional regulator n=1 Tax=Bradyrhizobium lablabi TaxID=722472 RepID=UPI001BA7F582|nr:TetR/AcrR family transcriptional regulator [Bradyrhizobium lablabi]MBR1121486.1 TetR/AcrR family transcriptional regulator [Bradyrhizobium lablabi]
MAQHKTVKTQTTAEPRRGPGRPQLRSDEETRDVIIDAARHEFTTSGFAASSMENIARRAGISTKTLYRLVPTKAALFEALIVERQDRFVSAIRLRACGNDDIEAALREALLVCAERVLDADVTAIYRMVLAESDTFPELARTFYTKAMRLTVTTLAKWLESEKQRGLIAIDDAELAAGMLLGMVIYMPQRDVMFGKKPLPKRAELERRVQICAALFLNGARASGASARGEPC